MIRKFDRNLWFDRPTFSIRFFPLRMLEKGERERGEGRERGDGEREREKNFSLFSLLRVIDSEFSRNVRFLEMCSRKPGDPILSLRLLKYMKKRHISTVPSYFSRTNLGQIYLC